MNAQDAETARSVLDFANKLDSFTKKVQKLEETWDDLLKDREAASPAVQNIVTGEGKLFGIKTRKVAKGFTRRVNHPLAPKTNFSVKFEDGTVIHSTKACNTFAEVIDKIGAKKVAGLSLICCGEQLVSKQGSTKYPSSNIAISDGLVVITHSSTKSKQKYIQTIAKALKMKLTIIPE